MCHVRSKVDRLVRHRVQGLVFGMYNFWYANSFGPGFLSHHDEFIILIPDHVGNWK